MGSIWSWFQATLHSLSPNCGKTGYAVSRGLLLIHALSGCDTVSAFHGIGKKTAWAVWCSMPHLATVFSRLARAPSQVSPDDFNEIERYVVLLYQRTSSLSHVNGARKQLFAQNRNMENIPPTLHALEQHVKRAVYHAGHIWGQSLIGEPEVPSPDGREWHMMQRGLHAGPLFQRQPRVVRNSWNVVARRPALNDASV